MQLGGRRDLDVQFGADKGPGTRAMQLYHRSRSQERDLGVADYRGTIPRSGGLGTWAEQIGARGGRAQKETRPRVRAENHQVTSNAGLRHLRGSRRLFSGNAIKGRRVIL